MFACSTFLHYKKWNTHNIQQHSFFKEPYIQRSLFRLLILSQTLFFSWIITSSKNHGLRPFSSLWFVFAVRAFLVHLPFSSRTKNLLLRRSPWSRTSSTWRKRWSEYGSVTADRKRRGSTHPAVAAPSAILSKQSSLPPHLWYVTCKLPPFIHHRRSDCLK